MNAPEHRQSLTTQIQYCSDDNNKRDLRSFIVKKITALLLLLLVTSGIFYILH